MNIRGLGLVIGWIKSEDKNWFYNSCSFSIMGDFQFSTLITPSCTKYHSTGTNKSTTARVSLFFLCYSLICSCTESVSVDSVSLVRITHFHCTSVVSRCVFFSRGAFSCLQVEHLPNAFPEHRKNRQKEETHESQRPSYRPRVTRNIIEHYSPRSEDFLFPVMHFKRDVKVTYEDFDAADTAL